jgi:hypothetical protein
MALSMRQAILCNAYSLPQPSRLIHDWKIKSLILGSSCPAARS